MSDTDILCEIRDALKAQAVPIGHRLRSADDVADYLRVQRRYVLDLARVTGHRDLRQLDRYYHQSAEELAEKIG